MYQCQLPQCSTEHSAGDGTSRRPCHYTGSVCEHPAFTNWWLVSHMRLCGTISHGFEQDRWLGTAQGPCPCRVDKKTNHATGLGLHQAKTGCPRWRLGGGDPVSGEASIAIYIWRCECCSGSEICGSIICSPIDVSTFEVGALECSRTFEVRGRARFNKHDDLFQMFRSTSMILCAPVILVCI